MIKNRLTQLFETKKNNVLSLFYTAGFPNLDSTLEIAKHCQDAGVDLLEIGIPFSDSLVDGPTIQASNEVALKNGMNLDLLFQQLASLRTNLELPVVLMGCLNPIERYGMHKFCKKLVECGIDGALIADLPAEVFESEYKQIFDQNNLSFISLLTTRTDLKRAQYIDQLSTGFLYLVSSAAVTGGTFSAEADRVALEKTKTYKLQNPMLMGFGIRDSQSFNSALEFASGAIVGSAFIRALAEENKDLKERVSNFVKGFK